MTSEERKQTPNQQTIKTESSSKSRVKSKKVLPNNKQKANRTLSAKEFAYATLAKFSANYLSGVVNIVWCVLLNIFILTLFTVLATMFDAPADNASQIELLTACLNFAVGVWLSGNGVVNEQIIGNFNYILLGSTLFTMLIIYIVFRKVNQMSRKSKISTSSVYMLIVFGIYALNNHSGGVNLLAHLPLPFLVALTAIMFASYEGQTFSRLRRLLKTSHILIQIPRYVILSLRGTLISVALILILSAVMLFIALTRSVNATESIFVSLNSSPFTAISISILTLTFLPNLVMYSCSIVFFGELTLGGGTNLFPPFPAVAPLLHLEDMRNMHAAFPTLSFMFLIVVFLSVNVWQMRLNSNETLFTALSKRWILVSIISYYTLTVFLTILLTFVCFLFLGYVSSGSIANTVRWVGVDPMAFACGFILPALISGVVCVVVFIAMKILKPNELNVILKVAALQSTHSNDGDVNLLQNKNGGRNVSSTRQKQKETN